MSGLFSSSLNAILATTNVGNFISDWASNTLRTVIATIDKALYAIISVLYDILDQITRTTIFSDGKIDEFAARVYTFLGIIMIFKVTFSLISYLVNPDTISDNTNGIGNMAKNFVITLVLIVAVPFAFDFLYAAQNAIINDNLIPRLILGTNGENVFELQIDPNHCEEGVEVNSSDFMALVALRPFYQINDGMDDDAVSSLDGYCDATSTSDLLQPDIYKATADNADGEEEYVVDYSSILSTATGVVVLLLLLTACMDIALRSIKLGFLELVAPIPIVSYVDPKSGKDGMFKKWLDEVWKTWLSLFVRLATIYFAIYVISLINDAIDKNMNNGLWVTLFLLIGALMFAKQAPKLLEDIFGIKFDELNLHPIKKVKEQAALGDSLVQTPGRTLALAAGGLAAGYGATANYLGRTKDLREAKVDLKNAQNIQTTEQRRLNQLKNEVVSRKNAVNILQNRYQDNYKNMTAEERTNAEKAISNAKNRYLESVQEKQEQDKVVTAAQQNVISAKDKVNTAKQEYEEKNNRFKPVSDEFRAEHPNVAGVVEKVRGVANKVEPAVTGVTQTARGAIGAATNKEAANIAKSVSAGLQAAASAAKTTNDLRKFGYLDRLRDLQTDITGVKNDSGTTSIVENNKKLLMRNLENIEGAIDSLNNQIANLPMGLIDRIPNEKNEVQLTINSEYVKNHPEVDVNAITTSLSQRDKLIESRENVKKEIKEMDSVLNINKKS